MAPQSPHLLMVLNDIDWFWSHRLPLVQALLDKGWSLTLATAGSSKDQGIKDMGIDSYDLPDHTSAFNPLLHISIIGSIKHAIQDMQPDLVHAITIRHAFYTGIAARFCGHKKLVLTVAGLGSLFSRKSFKASCIRFLAKPLLRFAFDRAGVFLIFQNPDDQKALIDHAIVKVERTSVIKGSGVDIEVFQPAPFIQNSEKPVILFASRLLIEKGIKEFIAAARILKDRADFIVAGDIYAKNPHSLTREEVQSWHDEGIITWLGQHSDMASLFARSTLVTLPSYYGEGVPKVLLEAMACGRPIITTDLPGCRETVDHKKTGLLIPGQDVEALIESITYMLDNPTLLKTYGAAARKKVEGEFTTQAVVQKTLSVYHNMDNAA